MLLELFVGGEVVPTFVGESLDLGVGRREELVVDGESEEPAAMPSTVLVGVI